MTHESFEAALKPKVQGSWNLHTLLPSGMDFFVLLSSLSGIAGLHGQANYSSGNTYQDALARARVMQGEKAVSLDLCNMMDIGYVSREKGLAERITKMGYMDLEEIEFHALLDYYCNPRLPLAFLTSQVVIGIQSPAIYNGRNLDAPAWLNRPLFRPIHMMRDKQTTSPGNNDAANYKSLLVAAETISDAADIIVDGLCTKLAKTLAVEKENIEPGRPINSYGVDSLSAVEIRTWFRSQISVDVSVFDILGNSSIAELAATVAPKSQYLSLSKKVWTELEY
jgi:hypothetical protein